MLGDPCLSEPSPSSSSTTSSSSTVGLPAHPPPSQESAPLNGWLQTGGLRDWNVSLALQGSHPPERCRTAQSLLINHCQGCPGPGPDDHLDPPPFLLAALPRNLCKCVCPILGRNVHRSTCLTVRSALGQRSRITFTSNLSYRCLRRCTRCNFRA